MLKLSTYSKFLLLLIILMALTFVAIYLKSISNRKTIAAINSFDDCVSAGYPVRESYPAQCATPDGRVFPQIIMSKEITVSGNSVCLPHKQTDGPQTLECALGLQDENGDFYALRDETSTFLSQIDSQKNISVTGNLSQDTESKYNIVGVIEVTSINNN